MTGGKCSSVLIPPLVSPAQLLVWNSSSLLPVQQYSDHLAAVKAIAWSPHQHGLLASGGGTADRCLRFWNTLTGQALQSTDTGSQVCNLAWSKHANELVRRHARMHAHTRRFCSASVDCVLSSPTVLSLLTGEHSRLLSEPDLSVEVSVTDTGGQVDWTLLQSAVSGKAAATLDLDLQNSS